MMTSLVLIHVLISSVGIVSGFVVILGLTGGKRLDRTTSIFLISTVLTSLSGFILPAHKILPSHIIGLISLVVLAAAWFARYPRGMAGQWRSTYVVSATSALYFNVFVLVFQAFLKIPALKALAPTQSEPPFAIAQGVVLLLFIALGVLAVRGFRPAAQAAAAAR
jgi:hypothetical protein